MASLGTCICEGCQLHLQQEVSSVSTGIVEADPNG